MNCFRYEKPFPKCIWYMILWDILHSLVQVNMKPLRNSKISKTDSFGCPLDSLPFPGWTCFRFHVLTVSVML